MKTLSYLLSTVVGLLMTLSYSSSLSYAQQSYPMLMSLDPVAAQIGTTSDHTLKSRYTMEGAYEVLISGDGVTGKAVLPETKEGEKKPASLQSLKLQITVADDATPGIRDFRIATPTGISTTGQLVIVRDPVTVETGDNNTLENANDVSLPAAICGRIEKAEDVDVFKIHADAGDEICFHVRCMRLQDRIHDLQQHADPMLSIRNSSGSTIAAADNVFAADPFLTHRFEETGDYFLEVRDVRYQGNQYWNYCIEANKRPFIQTIFPIAIQSDQASVEIVGRGLKDLSRGKVSRPHPMADRVQKAFVLVGSQSVPIDVFSLSAPQPVEDSGENDAIDTAQTISIPGGINGRMEKEGDLDLFRFEANKGKRYTFEVFARRAGSSLDSHLRILNEKGSQLAISDDTRIGKRNFADSRVENWLVPDDGTYFAEIRDVHLRGGPSYVYYLNVSPSDPHFQLYADTDKTPLTPGMSGVVYVRAEKKNGFDSPIQLHVEGLPEGVTATCGQILPKRQDGCVVLTASKDAKLSASPIRIFGTSGSGDDSNGGELAADATIYQETYQPGGGRGHWPVVSHVVSVGEPGDILKITLSTKELALKQGQSASIDIDIERAEGFDKNVTLEVIYKHLSSIYGDPLPQGVTIDKASSKVLLTAGATKGKLTFKAAADAQLVDQQIITVMANVSINFVMKATYASDPIRLTVTQ